MIVIKYVSTNCPLFRTHVTISGLCEWTVVADKRATVQSIVVIKTCASLFSWPKTHELSVLHVWECDTVTRNAVNKQIGQPKPCQLFVRYNRPIKYVELLRNRKHYMFGTPRTVRNEEEKTSFSEGRSA